MGFSAKQVRALRRNLSSTQIRTKERNGQELRYVEAWHTIAEANRIFGFDGWDRETVESRCVGAREVRGAFHAVYMAKVRITVRADGLAVVREGHGVGEGRGNSLGETHDLALKAAETDATRRALATFGKPFGLALYLKDFRVANGKIVPAALPAPANSNEPQGGAGSLVADTAVPLQTSAGLAAPSQEPALCGPELLRPLATFPGVVEVGSPRRIRDRGHLKFVTTQPCLLCGRRPSDAHHLRFAQPRAMGMKVSDEFTIPLCRLHHREAHNSGNEISFWSHMEIDVVAVAKELWDETLQRRQGRAGRQGAAPAAAQSGGIGSEVLGNEQSRTE
jgi:hypothetical protein